MIFFLVILIVLVLLPLTILMATIDKDMEGY
jgi:hypothetical protein